MAIATFERPCVISLNSSDHTQVVDRTDEFRFNRTNIVEEAHQYYFNESDPTLAKIRSLVSPELLNFLLNEDCTSSCLPKNQFKLIGEGGKVLEHKELSEWVFKGKDESGKKIENDFGVAHPNKYNHIHRVFMAERMRRSLAEIVQSVDQTGIKIIIPHKKLVPVSDNADVPLEKRFIVVCENMNVHDGYHSKKKLKSECNQKQLETIARMICDFIIKTGYMDANSENIVLHKDFNSTEGNERIFLTVLDTEPHGALYDISDPEPRTRMSLSASALIGLQEFKQGFSDLPIFVDEANLAIARLRSRM